MRKTGPLFVIDPSSSAPLHEQLCAALRTAISKDQLSPGNRLPSTRELARRCGVSRNTVLTAYAELIAEGLIEGRAGAGTRVRAASTASQPSRLRPRQLLRLAHYPSTVVELKDPDGHPIQVFTARPESSRR